MLDKESLEALEGVNNIYDLKQLIAMTLSIPYNSIMLQDFTTDQGDDDKISEMKESTESIKYKVINNGNNKPKKVEDRDITS